jgi:hypothetical protein
MDEEYEDLALTSADTNSYTLVVLGNIILSLDVSYCF